MTKAVRITNADSGTDKEVVIDVYEGDTLMITEVLLNPADQMTYYLTDTRSIRVRERDVDFGQATPLGSGGPIPTIPGGDQV